MSLLGATTRHRGWACPFCAAPNDAAAGLGGDWTPNVGDAAICLECVNIAIVSDSMTLREPTGAEIAELAGNAEMRRAMFWAGAQHANRHATDAEIEEVKQAVLKIGHTAGRLPLGPVVHGKLEHLVDALGRDKGWNDAKVFGVVTAGQDRAVFGVVSMPPPAYAMFPEKVQHG